MEQLELAVGIRQSLLRREIPINFDLGSDCFLLPFLGQGVESEDSFEENSSPFERESEVVLWDEEVQVELSFLRKIVRPKEVNHLLRLQIVCPQFEGWGKGEKLLVVDVETPRIDQQATNFGLSLQVF